jgi:hypothetical protein
MLSHYELYVKGKTFFKSPDFETLCKQTPMSRSSKTPHGFYLANRGIKAAPRRSVHPAGRGDAGFGAIKQHLPRLPPMSEKVVAGQDRNPPGTGISGSGSMWTSANRAFIAMASITRAG